MQYVNIASTRESRGMIDGWALSGLERVENVGAWGSGNEEAKEKKKKKKEPYPSAESNHVPPYSFRGKHIAFGCSDRWAKWAMTRSIGKGKVKEQYKSLTENLFRKPVGEYRERMRGTRKLVATVRWMDGLRGLICLVESVGTQGTGNEGAKRKKKRILPIHGVEPRTSLQL
jgi:hypothetical protein